MSRASKLKAAKQREHDKRMSSQEEAKLDRNAERLRTMTGGFTFKDDVRLSSKPKHYVAPKVEYRTSIERLKACPDPVAVATAKKMLTPEEELREQAAQYHIKQRQAHVMPLYNKGGPQYAGEFERGAAKKGELKRR